MQVQQSTEVKLRRLEKLDLADVNLGKMLVLFKQGNDTKSTNILQGVNSLGSLFNFTANDLGDKLCGKLREGAAGSFALHDLSHLLADSTDLRRAGVCGLLNLVRTSLRESDGKQTQKVVIGRLDSNVGLDERLPLAHKGSQLVSCEVQAVEVGQAVFPLDLVHAELDFAECVVFVVLQVSEGDLEDPALQRVVRILQTTGPVDQSFSNTLRLVSD